MMTLVRCHGIAVLLIASCILIFAIQLDNATAELRSTTKKKTRKQSRNNSSSGDISSASVRTEKEIVLTSTGIPESFEPSTLIPPRRLSVSEIYRDLHEDTTVQAFIGYRTAECRHRVEKYATISQDYAPVNVPALAVKVSIKQLKELELDPDIEYIENDDKLYPLSAEKIPYGITMIKAKGKFSWPDSLKSNSPQNCKNSEAFRIAIIDTGVDAG